MQEVTSFSGHKVVTPQGVTIHHMDGMVFVSKNGNVVATAIERDKHLHSILFKLATGNQVHDLDKPYLLRLATQLLREEVKRGATVVMSFGATFNNCTYRLPGQCEGQVAPVVVTITALVDGRISVISSVTGDGAHVEVESELTLSGIVESLRAHANIKRGLYLAHAPAHDAVQTTMSLLDVAACALTTVYQTNTLYRLDYTITVPELGSEEDQRKEIILASGTLPATELRAASKLLSEIIRNTSVTHTASNPKDGLEAQVYNHITMGHDVSLVGPEYRLTVEKKLITEGF